jgi:predicted  nucleic acid-binding Zn-ribbon protein
MDIESEIQEQKEKLAALEQQKAEIQVQEIREQIEEYKELAEKLQQLEEAIKKNLESLSPESKKILSAYIKEVHFLRPRLSETVAPAVKSFFGPVAAVGATAGVGLVEGLLSGIASALTPKESEDDE